MEKPKNLCTTHGHELRGGNAGGNGGARQRGIKGENGTSIIAQSIKCIQKIIAWLFHHLDIL